MNTAIAENSDATSLKLSLLNVKLAFSRELRAYFSEKMEKVALVEENALAAEIYASLFNHEASTALIKSERYVVLSRIPVLLKGVIISGVTRDAPIALRLSKPMPFDIDFTRFECEVGTEIGDHIQQLINSNMSHINSPELASELKAIEHLPLFDPEENVSALLTRLAACGRHSRALANSMIDAAVTLAIDSKSVLL